MGTFHAAAEDKNPGTVEKPFKTINAALAGARLKGGDTLYVHEGVYREKIDLSCANAHHGEAGAHVRILTWPKDVVEIKGSDIVTDWKKHKDLPGPATTQPKDALPWTAAIYVKENWPHNTQQVFCDGKVLTQIAGYIGEGYAQEAWQGRKGNGVVELKWDSKTTCDDKNTRTEVGFESKNGSAKIFLTTWDNDNEWYPIKEIEWVLDDDSATVLIFGVTAK